jgi:hypothetical protein
VIQKNYKEERESKGDYSYKSSENKLSESLNSSRSIGNELVQTPSLREIYRADSYKSLDSNKVRNWAVKY